MLLSLEEVFIETFNCVDVNKSMLEDVFSTCVVVIELGIAIKSFVEVEDDEVAEIVIDVLDVNNFVTDVVNVGKKLVAFDEL